MNTAPQHIPEDDLALFALALLPPDEAARSEAHMRHCGLCRSEVARLQGDLVVFAFTAEMQNPPSAARNRLLQAVSNEKRSFAPVTSPAAAAPATGERPAATPSVLTMPSLAERPARRGMGFFGWAGWAIAAGTALFAGWEFTQTQNLRNELSAQSVEIEQVNTDAARAQRVLHALTDPAAMQVALHLTAAGTNNPPRPEGHASYNAANGELVFVATHLEPIQADKAYELWVLPASGAAPIAAGTFRPDLNGNASVVLPQLPKDVPAKGFGITLENEGGSKSPTLPILLAGA